MEVAARPGPAKVRDAATAKADLRAGLRPGRDLKVLVAFDGRDPDPRTKRRLGDGERSSWKISLPSRRRAAWGVTWTAT